MKHKHYAFISMVLVLSIFLFPALVNAQAIKDSIRKNYTLQDYENFLQKEMRGEIPNGKGLVPSMRTANDALVNNNTGATGTQSFTQSETTILAYGSNVLIGFNDAGSFTGGANKFTGFSYSNDGGSTFTDGGTLPTNAGGDAGDPVLARNENTGRIYFSTLGFVVPTIQVFHSDDDGITWSTPVNGTPGGASEDKQWIAVDNFAGAGNGNVYLMSRNFGAGNGIYMYRSTDNGATFGPNAGVLIVSGMQGAFVVVGPDHSVYAFWYNGTTIKMRKSTDQGLTFATAVDVATGLAGPEVNGGLSLTGIRQGTASYSGFRSSSFPHAAVNPVSGDIYVTFNDNPAGSDKGDIYLVTSTDGGATWSARTQINDDGTTADNWQPTIAVTPNGNSLGIFYYSREDDAIDNNLFTYNGRQAVISGSTLNFTPSFVISDIQSLPEFGRDAVVNSTYMGDYNSATATATDFHVVWSDNRDDLSGGAPRKDPNVYYKSIPAGLLAGANISVAPVSHDFGFTEVNQTGGPFQFTITNIGDADLTVSGISSPDPDFSISLPALPAVIASLGSVTVEVSFTPLTEGTQSSGFDITSDALNSSVVSVNLTGTGIVAPANDLCEDAIAIDCGASVDGYTMLATIDNVVTCGGETNTGPGVWYSIVGNGYPLTLSTCTSASFDTKISVFSGTCGALVCEGGNDNSCGSSAALTFPTTDGTTYYVLIHGAGTTTGTFTLTALCSSEIEVDPTELTFDVPLNGTSSGQFTISNAAGSNNLAWTILGSENPLTPYAHVFSNGNQSEESESYKYKVTNGTIFTLLSENISVDILYKLDQLKNEPVLDEKSFTSLVTNAIGEVNASLYLASILDKSKRTEEESEKLSKGIYFEDEEEGEGREGSDYETYGQMSVTGSGGPDAGNYFWVDSDEPGGPIFNWTDITGTGTSVTLGDDASILVTLPFSFPFYGNPKTEVRIGSNGYLTFGASGSTFTNASIPNAAVPNDIICPFWDDLNPALAGGTIHYLSSPTQFIVQYTYIKPFAGTGDYTFQVILNDDGSILYQYFSMTGSLISSTVGIENSTGSSGLQVTFNAAYLHDNLAVLFSLPEPCPWITSVLPISGTLVGGDSQQVTVDVDATGLALGVYECHLTVFSNAANSNKIDIPVTLNVTEASTALTLPFFEGWETSNGTTIGDNDMYSGTGFAWAFETTIQNKGMASWGTNAWQAHTGSGALTLDKGLPTNAYAINSAIITMDMSNYTTSAGLELSFWWTDHGDEEHPNDKVWIRGSDADAWIVAYDINPMAYKNNQYNFSESIDIDELLASAGQTVSESFQMRFGQEDNGPIPNDGISFDDISVIEIVNSAAVLPFVEDWESYSDINYFISPFVDEPTYSWAFETSLPGKGKVSYGTFAHQSFGGAGAMTLDKDFPTNAYAVNATILTINLENYVASTDLELSFYWTDHGDEEHPNDKVWIRGSESGDWVMAFDINPQAFPNNQYRSSGALDIDQLLAAAIPPQTVSETFQVKFGQEDNGPVPNDGLTFDDITIQENISPPAQADLLAGGINGNQPSNLYDLINYPNPFKGTTTIQFTLENSSYTKLTVYNSLGVEVAKLYDSQADGKKVYQLEFNSLDLPSGIYFYHLQTSDGVNTIKKMQLIK